MADVTIRLRHNPKSGKRELVIQYESEEDLLAHEHERDHRALVERLIGQPIPADVDNVVVERVEKAPGGRSGEKQTQEEGPVKKAQAEKERG